MANYRDYYAINVEGKRQVFGFLGDALSFFKENPGWRMDFARMDPIYWRHHENRKLSCGEYTPLPVFFRDICTKLKTEETEYHYAHRSSDGKAVAYTPNHEYGVLEKHVTISPGRYIQKFFGDKLSPQEVREAANKFTLDLSANLELVIGNTREDFRFAFEDQDLKSPSSSYRSCMSFPREQYRCRAVCHPAEVYAADDLSIAYLVHPEARNRVLARAILYPKNDTFSKIYATDHQMKLALETRLTEKDMHHDTDLYGARLLAIPFDTPFDGKMYAMPYIDGEDSVYVKLRQRNTPEEYFVISSSYGEEADGTDGGISL
jgi:hypothetical protein